MLSQKQMQSSSHSRNIVRMSILISLLITLNLILSGCMFLSNRAYDFCDIFQLSGGITAENPKSGMIPPSLGAHVQVTEFINLGAIHFTGLKAEMDGRGFYAGPESRTRLGLGPYQAIRIEQDYTEGYENYFKKQQTKWTHRMNSPLMRWKNKPAKELDYEFWAFTMHQGFPVMPRGWHYWENASIELGICEPFCTHLGFYTSLGFDHSEVSDFVLGFFTIDYKNDDLNKEEFEELSGPSKGGVWESKPPSQ